MEAIVGLSFSQYLGLSYFNYTPILAIFPGMFLPYIHSSDFNETYETLADTCIQICLLTRIKFCDFGVTH